MCKCVSSGSCWLLFTICMSQPHLYIDCCSISNGSKSSSSSNKRGVMSVQLPLKQNSYLTDLRRVPKASSFNVHAIMQEKQQQHYANAKRNSLLVDVLDTSTLNGVGASGGSVAVAASLPAGGGGGGGGGVKRNVANDMRRKKNAHHGGNFRLNERNLLKEAYAVIFDQKELMYKQLHHLNATSKFNGILTQHNNKSNLLL